MAKIRYIRRLITVRRMFRRTINTTNYFFRRNHVLARWYVRKAHDKLDDLFIKLFFKKPLYRKHVEKKAH